MNLSYWNAQFQFAEVIPDFTARIAAIKTLSADVDQQFSWDVLAYGEDNRQCVLHQIAEPSGDVRPVFIHGGFWRAQNASSYTATSVGLAALGTPVAHVEYRLMPKHRLSDLIADIANALILLIEKNPEDTRPFLLVGHSAGAHLALEALRHHHAQIGEEITQASFVIGVSGVYDLRPIGLSFLADETELTSSEVLRFSPIEQPLFNPAHVMLAVGGDETPEMLRQAQFLSADQQVALRILPKHDHLSVLDALYSRKTGFIGAIREHLQQQQIDP